MIIEYFLQKVLLHSQFFDLSIFAIFLHLLNVAHILSGDVCSTCGICCIMKPNTVDGGISNLHLNFNR
ncbi:unnamed protein product [Rhizophagus irregularis]|nr:unnamed protein product [Rhizophagus irregularis]CAB5311155.1 unnamed protein product [Rhizophagus irregularis]